MSAKFTKKYAYVRLDNPTQDAVNAKLAEAESQGWLLHSTNETFFEWGVNLRCFVGLYFERPESERAADSS